MNRRTVVKLMIGGAGVSVLAACGVAPQAPAAAPTAPPPAPAPTPAPTSAAAAAAKPAATAVVVTPTTPPAATTPQPRTGGTLRQAYVPGDPVSLDPMLKVQNDVVWLGIFERLTMYDANLKPQPMLAESWDISTDAKSVKINLRKGVQFHSGREMTSDDVKYSLQRAANPKVAAAQYTGMASWFSDVETPDKYTAIFHSEQPRPTIFDLLEFLNICDKDTLEGPDAKNTANGTGPFKFVEWVQGDHLTLTKNPNYWQSGKPYLDGIQIPILRDQQAMVTQLEAGSLDIARPPTLSDFNRLKKDSGYQALQNPLTGAHYEAGYNLTIPPWDNKVLRQALTYAVDKQRFVETILGGIGAPESLPWLPASPAYEESKKNFYNFDLDKAKSLLAQSGVTNLEFDFMANPVNNETNGFAQIYQSDLAKIGVTMNIKQYDGATWIDQVNNRKFNGIYFASGTYFNLSPSTAFTNGKAFNPDLNNSAYKSDKYVSLITTGATETDPAKLKAAYSQLNDLVLDENFVFLITVSPPLMLAKSNVQGIQWTAHESPWYGDVWLA
ncbi:MAG TPA: ABC transporter substrate-binding protein [Chloroflexota bacterium]|jgi:peptide/nickel transport system substrate-binding protein